MRWYTLLCGGTHRDMKFIITAILMTKTYIILNSQRVSYSLWELVMVICGYSWLFRFIHGFCRSEYMTFFMKSTLHSVYFPPTKYYGGEIYINIDKMCSNTTTLRIGHWPSLVWLDPYILKGTCPGLKSWKIQWFYFGYLIWPCPFWKSDCHVAILELELAPLPHI